MVGRVGRFRLFDILFGPVDPVLTAPNVGIRTGKLRVQFGNFQNGQRLLIFHFVADIHIDMLDIAGHFGVDVDILIRPESAGQCNRSVDWAPRGCRHGDGWHRRRVVRAGVRLASWKFENNPGRRPPQPPAI